MAFAFGSFVSEVIAILSSQLRNAGRSDINWFEIKERPKVFTCHWWISTKMWFSIVYSKKWKLGDVKKDKMILPVKIIWLIWMERMRK